MSSNCNYPLDFIGNFVRSTGRGSCQESRNHVLRGDKLQVELPAPEAKDPDAAAAPRELPGGKYGEMSTLGNYTFRSFDFRSKSKLRPFYSLVASITAEEPGRVEPVSNGVAMLADGPDGDDTGDGGDVRTRRSRP